MSLLTTNRFVLWLLEPHRFKRKKGFRFPNGIPRVEAISERKIVLGPYTEIERYV